MKGLLHPELAGIAGVILVSLLAGLLMPRRAAAQVIPPPERVESKLLQEIQSNGSADFVIEMAEQADLSAAYAITDWNERGQYVVDTLKAVADRSQKGVKGQLGRQGARFNSYFASNVVVVHGGSQRALEAVANLPEVARVRAPIMVRLEPVEEVLARAVDIKWAQAEIQADVAWGLNDIGAPAFWSAYGRQGEGIIVANIDSGVQYDHPALMTSYRCVGKIASSPECWNDAVDDTLNISPPFDDNGHGTHTMGTMVGKNATFPINSIEYEVGIASGATWIACKAFDASGNGTNSDILECAQWLLAPGGIEANRPHIVNNSWSGDRQTDDWFLSSIVAWRAAGIFPVFSAGNSGSLGCNSILYPADNQLVFSVAAHDQTRQIAGFSSKGSILSVNNPYTKPNISAPGVNVNSSTPTHKYQSMQGTSMAAPQVSGAVALLWSCNPALVGQIDQTFELIQNSADEPPEETCSGPASGDSNFTYGYGYLNVLQAGASQCIAWNKTYLPAISRNSGATISPDSVQNGGFELGDVIWTQSSANNWDLIYNTNQISMFAPHGGSWLAWLGGDDDEESILSQTITISPDRPMLHYWFDSRTSDTSCASDYFSVKIGSTIMISEPVCTKNATNGWVHRTLNLTSFGGSQQVVQFLIVTSPTSSSSVFLDDISLEVSNSPVTLGTIASGASVSSSLSSSVFRKDQIVE